MKNFETKSDAQRSKKMNFRSDLETAKVVLTFREMQLIKGGDGDENDSNQGLK